MLNSIMPLDVRCPELNLHCIVKYLNDIEFLKIARYSLAISHDLFLTHYFCAKNNIPENLAIFFASFEFTYGEGSIFSSYKSAFSFMFKIDVCKNGLNIPYLLEIKNWRSDIEFRYFKAISKSDKQYDRSVYHKVFNDEFTDLQMDIVSVLICQYADRKFKKYKPQQADFFKQVESEFILFGYLDHQYFVQGYDTHEEFHAARKLMEDI